MRDRDGAPLHYIAQLQDISERKRLEEHLRHLADHDPLTGLRNRRLFEHDLRLQVARSRRYGEQAALMVIDLDDFKRVNDRHGHKVGDDTLKAVARALTRRLRETDLVARLGGDEFAVLLPHIDRKGLSTVVEQSQPRHAGVEHRRRRCRHFTARPASDSPSSISRPPAPSRSSLEADRSMYAAKQTKGPASPPARAEPPRRLSALEPSAAAITLKRCSRTSDLR